jgi:CBS domain-containing protein
MEVGEAAERARRKSVDALPVNDSRGMVGMISKWELESAIAQGGSRKTLSELLHSRAGSPDGSFPHVHPDHGVEVALERMGSTGLNVLPVVSRASVRSLLGIVTLDDILDVYGLLRIKTE